MSAPASPVFRKEFATPTFFRVQEHKEQIVMSIPAESLIAIIRDTLSPERRALAAAQPGLVWQLEALHGHAAGMQALLAGRPSDVEIGAVRARVSAADAAFDTAHRYAYTLLSGLAVAPDDGVMAAAKLSQAQLYPMGLQAINVSFRRQVAGAIRFAEKLGREDVVAAGAAIRAVIPGWDDILAACVAAGTEMGAAIAALDNVEAQGASKAIEPRLFAARASAMAALGLFLKTVQAVYPASGDQAAREARASLLQPWLGFWGEYRKKVRSSGSADLDVVVEEPDTDVGGDDAPDAA